MKRALILIFISIAALASHAQKDVVNDAIRHLKNKSLDSAKLLIDQAVAHETTKDLATTWYYRGFIYKELYKEREKNDASSQFRITSFESFKHSCELDATNESFENNKSNLDYLSRVFFNDAVKTLNTDQYPLSLKNFKHFKETSKIIDPNIDLTQKTIEYKIGIATVYMQLYEQDMEKNKGFLEKTKESYEFVLDIDPDNIRANYNMGVLYYNQAVNIIHSLEYDTDMIALSEIQNDCIKLFKESLPFMELAHKLDPNNINTLKGLSGIYYSLNEIDKSNELKAAIEDLKKKQQD